MAQVPGRSGHVAARCCVSDPSACDIAQHPKSREHRSLLRFIACGSADAGKSTLIGRLLFESRTLFADPLAAVEADARKFGTQGNAIDFARLLDRLAAKHEQGITGDVAHRFFSTDKRKFIAADTPGNEQHTRNMVTGASTADAAILVVDARKGILTQTRRHSHLISLIGLRHIVVAINKMDLVNHSEQAFRRIVEDHEVFARQIGLPQVTFIPLSALQGDNIVTPSAHMPWHHGATLMDCLEGMEIDEARQQKNPLRLPVQWVNRPRHMNFRGFAGTLASGVVQVGDRIQVQPSGQQSTVARIVTFDGDLPQAVAGQSITLTLADEVDISRGDIISHAQAPASVADQFEATLVWMHEVPLLPGRPYLLKIGAQTVTATVTGIQYQVNSDTLEHTAAKELALNAVGVCHLSLDRPIAFDPYAENRDTGGCIVMDRLSNHTVGVGMLHFALRRSQNISVQHVDIDKAARSRLKHQKPCVLWLTGLSGAGKSTIANLVEKRLHALGHHTYLLDGDNVRHGLNKDLGFTEEDRVENIRRVAEVTRLMVDAGLIVLTAFISPFRAERDFARTLVSKTEFIEVFVDTPLAVAEERDVKGLYRKARRGEIKNFTGIDSPYEPPTQAELVLETSTLTAQEAAGQVIDLLHSRGFIQTGDKDWG